MNIYSKIYGLCCAIGICGAISLAIVQKIPAWHYLPYVMVGVMLGGLFGASLSFAARFFSALKHPFGENKTYAYGFVVGIAFGIYATATNFDVDIKSFDSIFSSFIAFSVASSFLGGLYGFFAINVVKFLRFIKWLLIS